MGMPKQRLEMTMSVWGSALLDARFQPQERSAFPKG
ncbi:hypothetical protein QF030_001103 [Streptomyces rishiriensis]|uniref:Uncharacterized protein n=1 Tax=Streptomyces rishiriensis TaxID=68264 RepID=A0ABU0NIM7_STRRH|nr:hypothetical protein [Streptomyces rishiriensis]